MNIKNLNEIRYRILSDMEKELVEGLVPTSLEEEEEGEMPVLQVFLQGNDEALGNARGEFFFLPVAPGDEVQYFVNLIILYESIPEENMGELALAVAALNTYAPAGTFAVDYPERCLVYKLSYPLPTAVSEDVLRDAVDLTMGSALQLVSDYAYLLTEVCDGKRSA